MRLVVQVHAQHHNLHMPLVPTPHRPYLDASACVTNVTLPATAQTARLLLRGSHNAPHPHILAQCAVSLDWLTGTFLQQHPSITTERMSTWQVVQSVVMPATLERRCRYTDLLSPHGVDGPGVDGIIGGAVSAVSEDKVFYFISHCWAKPFADLVQMLQAHFSSEEQRAWRRGRPPLAWSQVGRKQACAPAHSQG